MPEGFSNRYQTTLAAGVTAGALTGTVASVTGVPAVPFRAIISAEGANTDEIVLVTGQAGTTLTWTRAAEAIAGVQAASAHAIGATLTAIVTAAGLLNASVYDVRAYGAVADGVTDDTAAIQDAIDACNAADGGVVFVPPGSYLVLSLALKSNVRLVGPGATFTKNAGGGATTVIAATGTLGTATLLTANGLQWASTVEVTSAAAFAVGDYVLVRDATYKYGTSGRNQQISRITAIAGLTVTLASRLIAGYATASAAELVLLTPVANAAIEGLVVDIPVGTSGGGIRADLTYGFQALGVRVTGPNDLPGIGLRQSAAAYVGRSVVLDGQNLATGGFGYGISVGESCHDITIEGNYTENVRENVMTNNARDVLFTGNTMVNHENNGVNTHGAGCERVMISDNLVVGCKAYGVVVGFSTANAIDVDVSVEGNVLDACGASGITSDAPAGLENVGLVIRGNKIYRAGSSLVGTWYGIYAEQCLQPVIESNFIDGAGVNVNTGIYVNTCTDAAVLRNRIIRLTASNGINFNNMTGVRITGNVVNVSGYAVRSLGTSTSVVVTDNQSDGTAFAKQAGERWERNVWGSKSDSESGVASKANGGTITHNVNGTPSKYGVTATVAKHIAVVTAVSATTLTIALHDDTGAAVTVAENVAWWAAL